MTESEGRAPDALPVKATPVEPAPAEAPTSLHDAAPPIPVPAALEAEDEFEDSVFGEDEVNSTASIGSSILKYREENGRTYHAYKDGSYMFPNDEEEKDRHDLQHHQFALTFNGKLFASDIPEDKPLHRVLDIGTGTGIWAIDFADAHPESQVLGVDLSPIQPGLVPPNVQFEIDDVEQPWTYSNKFDFIHSRMMMGSLDNVPKFMGQALENLTPGGILEMSDITWPAILNDGEWPENSAHFQWAELMGEAMIKTGRRLDCARLYKDQMIASGFVNVVEKRYIWPMNQWPKSKHLKVIGQWQLENMKMGLEAITIGMFTRVLGWTKLEVDVFLAKVRSEFQDRRIHVYYEVFAVTGEKAR